MEGGGKQHISRVLFTATGPGGRAAGVTICLGPPLPAASSGSGGTEREDGQPLFRGPKPWPCSQPGFTEPAPLDAAGALLPHPCTLTCAGQRTEARRPPSAVCFCGTVLTVARTGRYPAGLAIGEPGLSSTGRIAPWPKPGNTPPIAITSAAFQETGYAAACRCDETTTPARFWRRVSAGDRLAVMGL